LQASGLRRWLFSFNAGDAGGGSAMRLAVRRIALLLAGANCPNRAATVVRVPQWDIER